MCSPSQGPSFLSTVNPRGFTVLHTLASVATQHHQSITILTLLIMPRWSKLPNKRTKHQLRSCKPEVILFAKPSRMLKQTPSLKWGLQRGTSVIPKSVTPSRIGSNFDLNGWSLSEEDEAELRNIKTRVKVVQDAWMPIKVFFGDDE